MIKKISINKTDDAFEITDINDNKLITIIKLSDLSLSGKDIYDNLFAKYPIEDSEVGVDVQMDNSIHDSNDVRIANEIKSVLTSIAERIQKSKNENGFG